MFLLAILFVPYHLIDMFLKFAIVLAIGAIQLFLELFKLLQHAFYLGEVENVYKLDSTPKLVVSNEEGRILTRFLFH